MVLADGSVLLTIDHFKEYGYQGFMNKLPQPSLIAFKIIACFAVFEAALQLALPGKTVQGPVSPAGNIPIYKVFLLLLNTFIDFNHMLCIVYLFFSFRQMEWQLT